MSAYVIVDVDVKDAAAYEEYRRQTPATVDPYDGRFLVRGGATTVLEGNWMPKRVIVIEFPTVARAEEWLDSPEYSAIKGIRHRAATTNMIVVEGVS
jgi:uncharacterized protein (DUF1330 family)